MLHRIHCASLAAVALALPAPAAAPSRTAPSTFHPLPARAATAVKGIVYTFSIHTQGMQGPHGMQGGQREMTMEGKGMVAGRKARIEFTSISAPEMQRQGGAYGSGSYILVDGGNGETFTVVDTKEKKYYTTDAQQLMQGANAMGAMFKMEISDASVDVQPLADTTVDSYHTKHYRMTQHYTMAMSIMGMHRTSRADVVSEYYFAPEFADVVNPYMRTAGGQGAALFNNPDYAAKMRAAQAKMYRGMPVLTVARHTSTDQKGRVMSSTTTMRVTSLQRTDVPSSALEIPPGYTKGEPAQARPGAAPSGAGAAAPARGTDSARASGK